MRLARRLKLVNDLGEEFDLSMGSDRNVFLSGPTGLGLMINEQTERIADGFFVSTSSFKEANSIAGSLLFLNDPYNSYVDFVNFVYKTEELQLAYSPGIPVGYGYDVSEEDTDPGEWYYAYCKVTKIDKSELTSQYEGTLVCGVEFRLFSPWSKKYTLVKTVGLEETMLRYAESDDQENYNYYTRYPTEVEELGNYWFTYGNDVDGKTTFDISGDYSAAYSMVCEFKSSASNPKLKLYSSGQGKVLSEIKVTSTFSAGEKLEISTRPENTYIRKRLADGKTVVDLTDSIDISTNPFARPVPGECYMEYIREDDYSGGVVVSFTVYDYYRSV